MRKNLFFGLLHVIDGEVAKGFYAQAKPALINLKIGCVVRGRVFHFFVQRFAAQKEKETGYFLLVERKVLGNSRGGRNQDLFFARQPLKRRHHLIGEGGVVVGGRIHDVDFYRVL